MKKQLIILYLLLCAGPTVHAQYGRLTEVENRVLEENREAILKRLEIQKNEELLRLQADYKVLVVLLNELDTLLTQRELRKLTYDYIYPMEHQLRFNAKRKIDMAFDDAVSRILIRSWSDISSPNMPILFMHVKAFNLTGSQEEQLLQKALELKAILKKKPGKDVWKEELEAFESILSEEQLDRFFNIKNGAKMYRHSLNVWKRLCEHGLTSDLDSVQACNQIHLYQLHLQNAKDRYAFDEEKLAEAIEAVNARKPLPVKRSHELANRLRAKKSTTTKGTFHW